MTTYTPQPGTLIEGTTRHQDLIPAFLAELQRIDPVGYDSIVRDTYPIPGYVERSYNPPTHEWWYSDEAYDLLTRLFADLDNASPAGHYFGAHPGDGADFGYWPINDEEI